MNRIKLTADTEIDPNGFRCYVDGTVAALGKDSELIRENEALRATVRKLEDRIAALENQIDDAIEVEVEECNTTDDAPIATADSTTRVTPREHRAAWAKKRTPYDR